MGGMVELALKIGQYFEIFQNVIENKQIETDGVLIRWADVDNSSFIVTVKSLVNLCY